MQMLNRGVLLFLVRTVNNTGILRAWAFVLYVYGSSILSFGQFRETLCGLSGSTQYFSTLRHTRNEFQKNLTAYKMYTVFAHVISAPAYFAHPNF
jgi:hypothetical protein